MSRRAFAAAVSMVVALAGCSEQEDSCSRYTHVHYTGVGTLKIEPERTLVRYESKGQLQSDWVIVPPEVPIDAPLDTLDGQKVLFEGLLLETPKQCGYLGRFTQALRITRLSIMK